MAACVIPEYMDLICPSVPLNIVPMGEHSQRVENPDTATYIPAAYTEYSDLSACNNENSHGAEVRLCGDRGLFPR